MGLIAGKVEFKIYHQSGCFTRMLNSGKLTLNRVSNKMVRWALLKVVIPAELVLDLIGEWESGNFTGLLHLESYLE